MPARGGRSTIAGIEYQQWFLALKLADTFFDDSITLYPEARLIYSHSPTSNVNENPISDVAIDDLIISYSNQKCFYSVKYLAPKGSIWTIASLKSEGILRQFKEQFEKDSNAKLTLISQSNSPILRELLSRASRAFNREHLERELTASQLIEWDEIKNGFKYSDESLIAFSKLVSIIVYPLDELKLLIKQKFSDRITNSEFIGEVLFNYASDVSKWGDIINQNKIVEYLDKKGIKLKSISGYESIHKQLKLASHDLEITNSEFNGLVHIDRKETEILYNWIQNPLAEKEPPIKILAADAGLGKTVIIKDLLIKLRENDIPVLGLKADKLAYDSISELKAELSLNDEIDSLFSALSESSDKIVLLIDQIDALSQSLSIKRKPLEVYSRLINKVRTIQNVRIVISCRTYDLNYDRNLQEFKRFGSITVSNLDVQDVNLVLGQLGIGAQSLSSNLISLLTTPLHLDIFCRIYSSNLFYNSIKTQQDLYNELWSQVVINIPSDSPVTFDQIKEVLFRIASTMYQEQKMVVSKKNFQISFEKEIRYLQTNSLITVDKDKIQFFHQSFFDYVFSRNFVESGISLHENLINRHQGLFIRSKVSHVIAFLRDYDHDQYIIEFEKLLINNEYRFHIKVLLVTQLGYIPDPTLKEKQLVEKHIYSDNNLCLIFLESINSINWFNYLRTLNFETLLINNYDSYQHIFYQIIRRLIRSNTDSILSFLNEIPNFESRVDFASKVIYILEDFSSPIAIKISEECLASGVKNFDWFIHIIENSLKSNFEWAIKKITQFLEMHINSLEDRTGHEFLPTRIQNYDFVDRIYGINQVEGYSFSLSLIKLIVSHTEMNYGESCECTLKADFAYYSYTRNVEKNEKTFHYHLIDCVKDFLISEVEINYEFVRNEVRNLLDSKSTTLLSIITEVIISKPELFFAEAFSLINRDKFLLDYDKTSNSFFSYQVRKLFEVVYLFLTPFQKDIINTKILLLNIPSELRYKWTRCDRTYEYKINSFGLQKFELLKSIPKHELIVFPQMLKQLYELERKFGDFINKEPQPIRVIFGGRTMKQRAYESSNLNWIKTFKEYDDSKGRSWGKVTELEHARKFQEFVKSEPIKFIPIIESLLTEEVPDNYIIHGLDGLKEGDYDIDKLKELYKRFIYKSSDDFYIVQMLRYSRFFIDKKCVDKDIIDFFVQCIENDSSDDGKYDNHEELYTEAINQIGGIAISNLIHCHYNSKFQEIIIETLYKVANGNNKVVKASALYELAYINNFNSVEGIKLFLLLNREYDSSLLNISGHSLQYMIHVDFKLLIDFFETSIAIPECHDTITRILIFSWIYDYEGSQKLLEQLLLNSNTANLTALHVALNNMSNPIALEKCITIARRYLDSEDEKIIEEFDSGFYRFKADVFNNLYPFLFDYIHSKIGQHRGESFFHYLWDCVIVDSEKCIDLFYGFEELQITNNPFNRHSEEPMKVLVGSYNALKEYDNKSIILERAMDIFDNMLKNPIYRYSAIDVIKKLD